MTAFALADKVCLITGATGIAAATARLVVREGGRVFVASLRPEDGRALHETIRADGPEPAFGFQAADLTRAAEVKTTVEACVERFGRIDAVFNVAGISGRHGASMWGLMNSMAGLGLMATTYLVGWWVGRGQRLGWAPELAWGPIFDGVAVCLFVGALCWLAVDTRKSIVLRAGAGGEPPEQRGFAVDPAGT